MPEAALKLVEDAQSADAEVYEPSFTDFWSFWPRREARKDAVRAWDRLSEGERTRAIVGACLWARVWDRQGRAVQFIPLPATWLRGERWEDEIPLEYQGMLRIEARPTDIVPDEVMQARVIPEYVRKKLAELKVRLAIKP